MSRSSAQPLALVSGLAAVGAALGLAATPAFAGPQAHQFTDNIQDFGVTRHSVSVTKDSTWAVSMDAQGDAKMFVSTDAGFRPHDASCAGDRVCTVDAKNADTLYVFVLAESDVTYDIIATPTKVSAAR